MKQFVECKHICEVLQREITQAHWKVDTLSHLLDVDELPRIEGPQFNEIVGTGDDRILWQK